MIITKDTPYFKYVRAYDADGHMLTLCREIDTDNRMATRFVRPTDSFDAMRWPWPTECVAYDRIEVRPPLSDKAAAAQLYAGIPNLTIGDPLL